VRRHQMLLPATSLGDGDTKTGQKLQRIGVVPATNWRENLFSFAKKFVKFALARMQLICDDVLTTSAWIDYGPQ